ncbi:olfactory receptor 13G1 [Alligator mississippiensis]|uniref:Olfactory receptor 13G1-like n=1 Tax=Alligator mississippiensis TaxID=8496 RepID=A0A151NT87_ALLMI|nr:olfactory receptor 13G1 [Alligator mississippiensis]KYO40092.1 olfactory receptor 13G1-like [Alligator mississippiensis]
MEANNNTRVSEFILAGLFDYPHLHGLFLGVILCLFMVAIQGNSLIILAIVFHPPLHKPMYFFIANLALLDIFCTSNVLPKMMQNLILGKKTISFNACMAQLFTFLFAGATELVFFTAMAFDRYVAICHPLHYVTIMTKKVCITLAASIWSVGAFNSLVNTLLMLHLDFCGPNIIQHFFCEIPPLLALSCSSTYLNEVMAFMADIFLAMVNVLLITMSYGFINRNILKIQGSEGKQKAFFTCSSHLVAVGLYYSTIIYTYIHPPSSYSLEKDKMVAVLYTLVTPVLNPLIYSLRNKEVKVAFRKILPFCKRN